ncbi:MAG TPA: hypothetical protein VGD67_07090 [Pseudonocardiaceae bacterium]
MRKQINQGFFEKLFIDLDGTVERFILTEPFASLYTDDVAIAHDPQPDKVIAPQVGTPDAAGDPQDGYAHQPPQDQRGDWWGTRPIWWS